MKHLTLLLALCLAPLARAAELNLTLRLVVEAPQPAPSEVLVSDTIVLDRVGQTIEGTGGASAALAEVCYENAEPRGEKTTRLIAKPGLAKLVSVRSSHNQINANLQGASEPGLNATLAAGRPIPHPEYEFTNPARYATDHAADTRCPVGVEVQATQHGNVTGYLTLNKAINLCRTAVRCEDFDDTGAHVSNGADHVHWPQPRGSFNDTLLLVDNPQSVHHHLDDFIYTSSNSVVCMLKRGGPVTIEDVSMGTNTHDCLLILGNDTNVNGTQTIKSIREDGANAVADSWHVRVDPISGYCACPIILESDEPWIWRSASNPFIKLRNYYGRFICRQGGLWFNGCIVVSGGTKAYHPIIELHSVDWRAGQHPDKVLSGSGWAEVIYTNCRVDGKRVSDSYTWVNGVRS